MSKSAYLCAAAPLLLAAQTAHAEEFGQTVKPKGYLEFGYQRASVDIKDTDFSLDFNLLEGRAGYHFNKYLAAEVTLGGASGSTPVDGTDMELGINLTLGAFGRVDVPLGRKASIFGRAGYSQYTFDFHAEYLPEDTFVYDRENGPSFGVGAEFDVSSNFAVRLEGTAHQFGESDVNAFGIFGVMRY